MSLENDLTKFFQAVDSEIETQSDLDHISLALSNALRNVRNQISTEAEIALTHALLDSNLVSPIKRSE